MDPANKDNILTPPLAPSEELDEDAADWAALTQQQRWDESSKLWDYYLRMGGSLDPEPDPQSPFYDPDDPPPASTVPEPRWSAVRDYEVYPKRR